MPTTANNDTSDLLILSDDTNATVLDESPMLDEENVISSDVISFDETPIDLMSTTEVKEEPVMDMNLDLTTTEVKEEPVMDMNLDLTATEVKEEPVMDVITNDSVSEDIQEEVSQVFSLEEATTSFVSQLEARKEQISNDISDDEKIIAIKEEKIKNLRSEIADYKKGIKELNEEDVEINNKINLVTWKNQVNEIKKTTTTKVHNAKRKKAA